MSERRKISVVVADDHPIVLAGFATMIRTSPEFEVVGEFRNGQDLLDGVIQLQPQIAVVDRVMPGLAGPEVMASLRRIGLKTRVVLISATFSADEIRSAASLGAAGVLRKDAPPSDFIRCLSRVGRGETWFPEPSAPERAGVVSGVLAQLTAREQQVAELVMKGCSNKEISRQLDLTEGTVKVHMYNMFQKLGLQNRTQLANVLRGGHGR